MKSALEVVVGLYEQIFTDLSYMHPSIKVELSRDISRLRKASLSSGLPLFTITLPKMSKFLERSLASGFLIDETPHLLGAKSSADKRPKLFYGLWCMLFEADGTLRTERDVSAVKSLRQVFLAVKKLRMECEDRYVQQAISEFRAIEESLPRSWPATWEDDSPLWQRRNGHPIWGDRTQEEVPDLFPEFDPSSKLECGVDPNWAGFRNFVARVSASLGEFYPYSIVPKHGPGAISDKDPSYVKYDGLHWTDRLESVFPYDWFGAPSSDHLTYVQYVEYSSRLHAVPKTQSGPRLIASEPTCHQWIQGGIQRWLEERIGRTILADSIDFRSQETSRSLALEASSTGDLCTIDLSSASDRLTTRLVEYCFQGNYFLLDAMHASRTRCVELPDRELILLRKFSTQGSALTFPVQTVVFAMLSVWASALTYNRFDWDSLAGFAKQVRVFGDDIIVPNDVYPVLTSLLEECKLKVNTSKSFSTGKFRESCGMDAYDGEDVTPAYFRQLLSPAPTSLESIVECSNNFHKKGMWYTADYIQKTVPYQILRRILIKTVDSGAFGLASFCGQSLDHLDKRWNKFLHQDEVKVLTILPSMLRKRGRGHGSLLQYFSEVATSPLSEVPTTKERLNYLFPNKYSGGEASSVSSRKALTWVNPCL
uniref:RNA-directed RNA polymerase n=1 Tax=Leviviridae sp. TaxID=2027243 RepID=A0A514DBG8_9VIRU|nr:MAG: RNA-dependent RNA polymerase [Leviviridae sp.]